MATAKVAWTDLAYVGVRLPLFLVSLLVPARWDTHAARSLWKASRTISSHSQRSFAQTVRQRTRGRLSISPEHCAEEHAKRRWEIYWGWLRAVRSSAWRVRVDWEGEEHLVRALNQGKGVILWFSSFCDNVIMLRALAEKGYRVVHLSRIRHGAPSTSLLGLGPLAGLVRSTENRYLEERVLMNRVVTPRILRRLEEALADNLCVTVRGDQAASPGVVATLFGRPVRLAPGAPSLAWKTEASLVTIGLRRSGHSRYVVSVEPPIAVDRSLERKEAVRSACEVFAKRLEARIEASPADWTGWRHANLWIEDSNVVPKQPARAKGASA